MKKKGIIKFKLTLVEFPMKKIACLPPTPKYDMSLFRERGILLVFFGVFCVLQIRSNCKV